MTSQEDLATLVSKLEAKRWGECPYCGGGGIDLNVSRDIGGPYSCDCTNGKVLNPQVVAAIAVLTQKCNHPHLWHREEPTLYYEGGSEYARLCFWCHGTGRIPLNMKGHGEGAWRGMLISAMEATGVEQEVLAKVGVTFDSLEEMYSRCVYFMWNLEVKALLAAFQEAVEERA